jgi:hypothetical protein
LENFKGVEVESGVEVGSSGQVSPSELCQPFLTLFHHAQRGKTLENFVWPDGQYLLALEGTGNYFSKHDILGKLWHAPPTPLYPNEYLVLHNGKKSALANCIAGEMANDFTIKDIGYIPGDIPRK